MAQQQSTPPASITQVAAQNQPESLSQFFSGMLGGLHLGSVASGGVGYDGGAEALGNLLPKVPGAPKVPGVPATPAYVPAVPGAQYAPPTRSGEAAGMKTTTTTDASSKDSGVGKMVTNLLKQAGGSVADAAEGAGNIVEAIASLL